MWSLPCGVCSAVNSAQRHAYRLIWLGFPLRVFFENLNPLADLSTSFCELYSPSSHSALVEIYLMFVRWIFVKIGHISQNVHGILDFQSNGENFWTSGGKQMPIFRHCAPIRHFCRPFDLWTIWRSRKRRKSKRCNFTPKPLVVIFVPSCEVSRA